MAIVNVKGTVSRTFFEGRGAEVVESFKKRDGTEGHTRWSLFFESEHGLSEGDQVEVSGMHGDKVDEWTDKEGAVRHTVKRTLNRASVKSGQSAPVSGVPQSSEDVWNQPGNVNHDETPF